MRNTFIDTLTELAAADPRIWLVTGDLGFSVLERFAERFPGRYLNVGVAEQNMTGMAAGISTTGKVVFTYSIANFPVMRCLEQVRNDICYHNLNVKIVAVGGGFGYGSAGYTHHGLEDLAVMSALPNMTVLAPGDPVETRLAVRAIVQHPAPCYLRLGKGGEPVVHTSEPRFEIGKAIPLMSGKDLTLISTGGILSIVMSAARALEAAGFSVGVLSMPTVSPLDRDAVLAAAAASRALLTVEEHAPGGLGSRVAEALAVAGAGIPFAMLTADRSHLHLAGSQDYLRDHSGLSLEAILAKARDLLASGRNAG
ncbi:MAG: transketolase [Anaerolineae bacterium]|nr:transketolase [Anaerolineae bacterium]